MAKVAPATFGIPSIPGGQMQEYAAMDGGDTSSWMNEVDPVGNNVSRAASGTKAESNAGAIAETRGRREKSE